MRLATWNVESIRAHEAQVLAWIDHEGPDIVCLQETRADERVFPRAGFDSRGFELTLHGGERGHGGVAIASRHPLVDVIRGVPGAVAPLDEPRSISATITTPSGSAMRLHTCYAPNGRRAGSTHHQVKLAWFTLFREWVAMDRSRDDDVVVVGDLNIAPTDLDVWDASRYRTRNLTSPAERLAFGELLTHGSLVDLVRRHHGDDRVFTWWNRRGDFYETDRGWRLDHALATESVADRVVSVTIDRDERGKPGAADHAPLLLDISS